MVLPSPEQMDFVIEGMRNPMNSWDNGDSEWGTEARAHGNKVFIVGDADISLMQRLSKAGTDHRKFMRMMPVMVRITAPLYWWKEFDTYKVGTVANSCSTMHKITEKEFTLEDFSCDCMINTYVLYDILLELNNWRTLYVEYESLDNSLKNEYSKTDIWNHIIQLLPSSYNQTRNVMLNYEVLSNIYHSRKDHKLEEWQGLCFWISTLPYADIITNE